MLDLYVNDSEESDLAARYLAEQGFRPRIRFCLDELPDELVPSRSLFAYSQILPSFRNSFGECSVPSLFHDTIEVWQGYFSFSGVKSFLRNRIIFEKMKSKLGGKRGLYWTDIQTFYPSRDYDKEKGFGKEQKLVTCFNKERNKIFEGPINQAPHNFEKVLDLHKYKHWYDVSSREIGNLEELVKKQNEIGLILNEQTLTVIFPDEIEKLRQGKIIPTQDYGSIMDVGFEAYFQDKGQLFGLYAYELD